MISFLKAGYCLVRQASRFRFLFFATAACTILAAIFPPAWPPSWPFPAGGSGAVSPGQPLQPVAPVFPDPASDQALQAFAAAVSGLAAEPRAGLRCEKLLDALHGLDATDRQRVAARASPPATAARPAIATAENCRAPIEASNRRFAALSEADGLAGSSRSAKAILNAAAAYKALDGFDRSRQRYANEAVEVARGKGFADEVDRSAARIDALMREAGDFAGDRSPAAYLRLTGALHDLSEFDVGRLDEAGQAARGAAIEAQRAVTESRTRLTSLYPFLDAIAAGHADQVAPALVTATASVTAFDEALATPEQKDALTRARAAATPLAWTLLRERVTARAKGETPEADLAVAAIYAIVKDTPAGDLTDPERALLAEAGPAADALAASDARLNNLLTAADSWRQRSGASGDEFLAPLHAVTPYDRARFQQVHTNAAETLSRAEAVIGGARLGLTDRTPLYVSSTKDDEQDQRVAEILRDHLGKSGFLIAADRNDAALLIDVAIDRIQEFDKDTSQAYSIWPTTADLTVSAIWASDESALLSGTIENTAATRDKFRSKPEALLGAIAKIVAALDAKRRR